MLVVTKLDRLARSMADLKRSRATAEQEPTLGVIERLAKAVRVKPSKLID